MSYPLSDGVRHSFLFVTSSPHAFADAGFAGVGSTRSVSQRRPAEVVMAPHQRSRSGGDGVYRDRTGDLRVAKPVPSESGEGGSEGESADLAGDSEPPLPGATGSDRRESDRAVGQAWDDAGSIDDDRVRSAGRRMTLRLSLR